MAVNLTFVPQAACKQQSSSTLLPSAHSSLASATTALLTGSNVWAIIAAGRMSRPGLVFTVNSFDNGIFFGMALANLMLPRAGAHCRAQTFFNVEFPIFRSHQCSQ